MIGRGDGAEAVTSLRDLTRGSLISSAIFHLALIVLVFVGLPQLFTPKPLEDTPIAVQLVTLAPETRATQLTKTPPKPDAKPEPQIAQATPEPPKPEPPKPEPPKPEPKPPEPKAELPKPEPPKAEPKPEPPKPKVVEAPKPKAKPEPPKPDQKQLASDFDSLLKNLTRQKTAPTPEDAQPKAKQPPAQQSASSQPVAPLGSQLTVSEKDLVIRQIQEKWNPPVGAKDAQNLILQLRIELSPDGSVTNVTVTNEGSYGDSQVFQSFADSGMRAVRRASPLKLPPDKFEQWKTTTLSFNLKDLL